LAEPRAPRSVELVLELVDLLAQPLAFEAL
jgi:hypothetical protein